MYSLTNTSTTVWVVCCFSEPLWLTSWVTIVQQSLMSLLHSFDPWNLFHFISFRLRFRFRSRWKCRSKRFRICVEKETESRNWCWPNLLQLTIKLLAFHIIHVTIHIHTILFAIFYSLCPLPERLAISISNIATNHRNLKKQ